MPERIRRQRSDKKAAQKPKSQPKPVEIMRDFEPPESEQASFGDVVQVDDIASNVSSSPALSTRQVMQLQRTIGNHATQQLIQRTQAPAIVAKSTHARTPASVETPASGQDRLIQREAVERHVFSDTNMRLPNSGTDIAGAVTLSALKKGQKVTIESSSTQMVALGPDGVVGGDHAWMMVTAIGGKKLSKPMWIHQSAIMPSPSPAPAPAQPPAPAPAPLPSASSARAPLPSPSPAPLPSISSSLPGASARPVSDDLDFSRFASLRTPASSPSSSVAPVPAPAPAPAPAPVPKPAESGPTNADGSPAWLRDSGDSSRFNERLTRAKYQYAGYNAVKTGLRTNYLATDGAEEFDPEAYKHSTDILTPSGLRHAAHDGASAVRGGVRDVVSDIRGGGGGGSGEHTGVAAVVSGEARSVLGTAKDFAATTAKDANKGDWVGWLQRALGSVLSVVSKFSPFVMLAKSIVGVIDKIIDYNAMKDGFASMAAKNKAGRLSSAEEKVYKTTKYGVAKIKRGMFERLAFFVGDLAKVIVHLITLLSGGTTFMVTEAIAVSISLAQGAKKFANGVKGAFKYLTGTRGKNRSKNAKVLVDAAFERQPEALTILRELNPFPLKEKWKMRAETVKNAAVNGIVSGVDSMGRGIGSAIGLDMGEESASERSSVYPQNNDEMYAKLLAFITGPKGAENRETLEKNVASKLKSS